MPSHIYQKTEALTIYNEGLKVSVLIEFHLTIPLLWPVKVAVEPTSNV
jgi:hypothetical protein